MSDMKNIYDVLDEIGFENQCEKYALGFHRDTDTPTMTKFRQESMKEFGFSLIQQCAEKVYEDFMRTRKALDVAINAMKSAGMHNSVNCIARGEDPSKDDVGTTINHALNEITALEQKD